MKKKWIPPLVIERVDRRLYISLPLKGIGPLKDTKICRPNIKNPLDIIKREK